ncbi:hypothetical protein DEJ23_08215 [Curtobacterium sp. MCSS17_008]|uniref:hypothetical protein n=1 Tax=Curtobacterium sp. MCSS17_008 TaxID=2175647 RepID=UPI000DA9CC61|nr:hypothetical protein [Curtobacterium sp. MCSS17_008]PZF57449.1 hypothetical protein DEJ23_08215 [Curtobacterium sp. MCSS17_008]
MTTSTDDETGTIDPRWARVRPLVFRTIIGAVVAAGLEGIVAVLLGDFGRVAVQLLLTVVVVVVFALLSWYDADVSSRRSGTFAFASIAVSMYLLVTGLFKVWVVPTDPFGGDGIWIVGERFWQWLGIVFVARFALLHVHLLLVIHRRYPTPLLQLVAKVTVALIALLALLLSVPLLAPDADLASGYWRLVWVVVILDLLGTVVVPLSNALFRPRPASVAWPAPSGTGAGSPHGPAGPGPAAPLVGGWSGTPEPAAPAAPAEPAAPAVSAAHAVSAELAAHAASTEPAAPAAPAGVARPTRTGGTTVTGSDGMLYEGRPDGARVLAWPRYVDGTPLPAAPDGSPDFSGVARP